MIKHTNPMTSMAMMLALCQPCAAFDAIVHGIKMSENAALKNMIPPISSSNQRFFRILRVPNPRHGDWVVNPRLLAFLLFNKRVKKRGKNMTGKIMHHIP